jgi:hypothetical protein
MSQSLCTIAVKRLARQQRTEKAEIQRALWRARNLRQSASGGGGGGGGNKRRKRRQLTQSAALASLDPSASAATSAATSATADEAAQSSARLREPIAVDVMERVDMAALEWIDRHRDRLFPSKGEATRFRRYAEMAREAGGEYRVRFAQRDHGVGRMYAENGMSLANLNRSVRAALARRYVDVDMSHAHPRIALIMAQRNGLATPQLRRIVAQREEVYKLFPCKRHIAKRMILSTLMGGSAMTVLREERMEHLRAALPAFAHEFANEIKRVRRFVFRNFTQLHCAIGAHKSNREASCLSFFLQEEELKVLLAARQFFIDNEREVGSLIYDGLLVAKDSARPVDAALLSALRSYVLEKTKYDIPFTVKEFSSPYEGCP